MDRFLLVASLFVVVFFSLSTEKRELYVLPAFPAIALLVAGLVAAVCRWNEPAGPPEPEIHYRWVTLGTTIVAGILALAGAVAAGLVLSGDVTDRLDTLPAWPAVLLGGLFLLGGAAVILLSWRGRALAAVLTLGFTVSLVYLQVVSTVYPFLEPTKSARLFAERVAAVTMESRAAGTPLFTYDLSNLPEAFAFYGDGLYSETTDEAPIVIAHLRRSETAFAAVDGRLLELLPSDLSARLWLVDRARLARRDVLLVVNREYPDGLPLARVIEPGP